jgi:hypothetical protein
MSAHFGGEGRDTLQGCELMSNSGSHTKASFLVLCNSREDAAAHAAQFLRVPTLWRRGQTRPFLRLLKTWGDSGRHGSDAENFGCAVYLFRAGRQGRKSAAALCRRFLSVMTQPFRRPIINSEKYMPKP